MNYHNAKKHSNATGRVGRRCKLCDKDFHRFYKMREHKRKEHGAQRVQEIKMLMLHSQGGR